MRLGRRPPKHAPALRLSRVLTGVIPPHPSSADHFDRVPDWDVYGNLEHGTCGPASVANQRKLVSSYLSGLEESPTLEDVYDLYRRSGNPGFDPQTGAGDDGVVMQTMLEQVVKGGIGGTRALAFAQVDVGDLEEIRAAIAIFGSLLLGVDLETAQQTQTGQGLWDYRRSPEWGGHAVLCGRYTDVVRDRDDRTAVVTWAEVVDMTDTFIRRQLEEAWVVVWPEMLADSTFLEGVDLEALAAYYRELTGRDFPVAPPDPGPPVPTPPAPSSDPADAVLVAAFDAWRAAKGL